MRLTERIADLRLRRDAQRYPYDTAHDAILGTGTG